LEVVLLAAAAEEDSQASLLLLPLPPPAFFFAARGKVLAMSSPVPGMRTSLRAEKSLLSRGC